MSRRNSSFVLLGCLLALVFVASSIAAKDKQELPDLVLSARTVLVVVDSDAADSARQPGENEQAKRDVEQALMKWGRFSFANDASHADLIITVQKGQSGTVGPTMGRTGGTGPVVFNPGEGGVMIGGHQGTPPPMSDPNGQMPDTGPHPGMQVGQSDDVFKVFQGGIEIPLSGTPMWRFQGKNALSPPAVNAVAQFRKAIERSEKAQAKKP